MSTLAITLRTGKLFARDEKVTNAKLNQLGHPTGYLAAEDTVQDWLDANIETVTGAAALNLNKITSNLDQTTPGPYAITIASGTFVGQQKRITCKNGTSSAEFDLTGTFTKGITTYKFGNISGAFAGSLVLQWDGASWHFMGGDASAQ